VNALMVEELRSLFLRSLGVKQQAEGLGS